MSTRYFVRATSPEHANLVDETGVNTIATGTIYQMQRIALRMNSHDALVNALEVARCEIVKCGTVDREAVISKIAAALELARGEG